MVQSGVFGRSQAITPPSTAFRTKRLPGEIVAIATSTNEGNVSVFGAASPGRYANLQLMDPGANDSDADGMPDGWEVVHGLDPTDPWDALFDNDADGLDLDQSGDMNLERLWTNLTSTATSNSPLKATMQPIHAWRHRR